MIDFSMKHWMATGGLPALKKVTTALAGALLIAGLGSYGDAEASGLRLHNAEQAAKANVVKEAADELNLLDRLQVERANQAKMLARELSLVEEFSIVRRDAAIRALLEPRFDENYRNEALSSKAQRFIRERLDELVGSGGGLEAAREVLKVQREIASKIETELRTAAASVHDVLKVQAPTCDTRSTETYILPNKQRDTFIANAIKRNPEEQANDVRMVALELLDSLVKACNEVVELNKQLAARVEGFAVIGEAQKKLTDAKARKATLGETLKTTKTAYQDAVAALKKAQEAFAENSSAEAEKELRAKVDAVREALGKLPKVAGPFGQREAAAEQVARIDILLASAGTDAPEDAETGTAQAVVAQLPSFYGRVVEIAAIRQAPSINALVLEKSRLQALRTDAEREIRRMNSEIDLLKAKRDTLLAEAQLLLNAHQHLVWAESANNKKPVTSENLKNPKVSEDARRHAIMGIALYLGTFTGPQRAVHETEYRLIDLKHQAAVDRSEVALVLWHTTIAQPTMSLSAYHAGGLKPEHIIELLKALGIGAIAVGVN